MAEDFEVTGAEQLRRLAADLAKGPPAIKRQLRVRLRAAATPMQQAVQADALAIPVHGKQSTGLRAKIAKATRIRVTTSAKTVAVRVAVIAKQMPAGQEKLPALMEGRGWKHPPPGGKANTIFQPGHSYFKKPAEAERPVARAAAVAALDEATRTLR